MFIIPSFLTSVLAKEDWVMGPDGPFEALKLVIF